MGKLSRRVKAAVTGDVELKELLKLEKKLEKEKRKYQKILQHTLKKTLKRQLREKQKARPKQAAAVADVPEDVMEKSKAMAPMTKEEWEQKQSVIRRVKDEETGRYRLIKGDGEVLEEIVSRDMHQKINRQATQADGAFFQLQTLNKDNGNGFA